MKSNKNAFIIGDSYSTYAGYIPKGYHWYYGDERKEAPIVKGVENTWWHILARENGFEIILNDSFSGSTVCDTVRDYLKPESSFVYRLDKYIAEGFFTENKIDTVFIFGGTNDNWTDVPVGELKYEDLTKEDLKSILPAFCHIIKKSTEVADNVVVIMNTNLKEELTGGVEEACKKLGAVCVRLKEIDKQCGHPTELGMKQIAEQVKAHLN